MYKPEIKNQKTNIAKIMEFFYKDFVKLNDYVILKRTGLLSIEADRTADHKSVVFVFTGKKPTITIASILKGTFNRIIVNESTVTIMLDGMPDVTVEIVS